MNKGRRKILLLFGAVLGHRIGIRTSEASEVKYRIERISESANSLDLQDSGRFQRESVSLSLDQKWINYWPNWLNEWHNLPPTENPKPINTPKRKKSFYNFIRME